MLLFKTSDIRLLLTLLSLLLAMVAYQLVHCCYSHFRYFFNPFNAISQKHSCRDDCQMCTLGASSIFVCFYLKLRKAGLLQVKNSFVGQILDRVICQP